MLFARLPFNKYTHTMDGRSFLEIARRSQNVGLQLESSVLSVKSLFAKLVEFDLTSKVAAYQVLHFLADWRFEEVPVDSREGIYLICVKDIEKHHVQLK